MGRRLLRGGVQMWSAGQTGRNAHNMDWNAKCGQGCYCSNHRPSRTHPPSVLSAPGSRLVRQTSNSAVAGLPMHAAVVPSSCCKGVGGRVGWGWVQGDW